MSDLKAVIELRQLRASCPFDPCFIKLILKQSQFEQPVDSGKLESRKELVLRGGRVDINEQFELPIETAYLRENKITVIVMASKGKEISLLGVGNIDFRKINTSLSHTVLSVPLEKCNDPKAELAACVRFSDRQNDSQETFDIDRNAVPANIDMRATQRSAGSTPASPNITQSIGNNTSRTQADEGRQRAIEISRRNFVRKPLMQKHSEVLRQDKRSASKDSSGSYKKRFEYQQRLDSTTPINRNSQFKVFGRKKPAEKEPVARQKTPQPIRFEEVKAKPIIVKPKTKEGFFSNRHETRQMKPERREPQTHQQQASPRLRQNAEPQESPQRVRFAPALDAGHIVSNNRSRSHSSSVDRYANLAEKLERIEQQIQREKVSIDTHHNNNNQSVRAPNGLSPTSVCTFGETEEWRSGSRNQQSCEVITSMEITRGQKERRLQLEETLATETRRVHELEDERAENQKLIDKLTKLYEGCQQKLLKQREEAEQLRRQQIEQHEEKLNRLEQQLSRSNKENDELRAQLSTRKPNDLETDLKNERRKVANLSSEIKFKENQLKFAKLSEESLRAEKRQLELEVRKLENKQPISRKESRAELESQFMNGYPSALRAQNKLLKDQVELLQKHNTELNALIEQKERFAPAPNNCKQHEQQLKQRATQIKTLKETNRLLEQKYAVLSEKSQHLEEELITTKNNFCEAMNVAFQKGGSELVDMLESKMTFRESS